MMNKKLKLVGLMLAGVIIVISFSSALNVQPVVTGNLSTYSLNNIDDVGHSYSLRSFSSYEEFSNFLRDLNNHSGGLRYYDGVMDWKTSSIIVASVNAKSDVETVDVQDFSTTNVQVQGVDEPDIVKTDGKYLYIVANDKVYIIQGWPAEDAKIVSEITTNYSITNIFINGDRLVIFGDMYRYYVYDAEGDYTTTDCPSPWYSHDSTYIKVYDITDRSQPVLKKDVIVAGNYFNARMIDGYVYIITTQSSYDIFSSDTTNDTIIPLISINGEVKQIPLTDIYCIDVPSSSYMLTHIVSLNVLNDEEEVVDKIFTLGNTQTMYVSKNNIYITYQINRYDYITVQKAIDEVVYPLLPEKLKQDIDCARGFDIPDYDKRQVVEWILEGYYSTLDDENRTAIQREINSRLYRTIIHKISVVDGKIEYQCNGSVPGRVLNQYSMDEYNGLFRVATQTDGWWSGSWNSQSCTNVFILDEQLNRVSSVEGISPGENMHSARFMGERAYLVTFKKTDPFFVLDLSDPYDPKILGELKIPGYSDYLHPYDENHIIGVGKDTDDQGSFAWYQGLKIALFDVSDLQNPVEIAKIIIGDRGTDSPTLYDPKSFLFSKEKGLLVIPVSLHEISEEIKQQSNGDTGWAYGNFTFQGAYVYKLSLDGFEYKGRITHLNEEEMSNLSSRYWYWGSSNSDITRSLYIGNVLYTISGSMVKMNSLDDLSEINSIKLL